MKCGTRYGDGKPADADPRDTVRILLTARGFPGTGLRETTLYHARMNIVTKSLIGFCLIAGMVAALAINWNSTPANPVPPPTDESEEADGATEAPVELAEGDCYAGEWIGCWGLADDPRGERFIRVSDDGCVITQDGYDAGYIVYGFTTDEAETFGPPGGDFTAPVGSLVFYFVPRFQGYDADPVMAIDSRRGPDGRVPTTSGVFTAWGILSYSPIMDLRTFAVVQRSEFRMRTESENAESRVPELRLFAMDCP